MSSSLARIPAIENPHYHRSGIHSYVSLLQKYDITPTMDGPFFMAAAEAADQAMRAGRRRAQRLLERILGRRIGSRLAARLRPKQPRRQQPPAGCGRRLAKKPANGGKADKPGMVTAQDQQNDSLYLCPVQVGTPPQTLMLDFDTGSSDLWLFSTLLPKSTPDLAKHRIFDAARSTTFKPAPSSSWKIAYGDGSSASGAVGTDVVRLGGLTIQAQAIELAAALSPQFTQGAGDGLLGLAFGSINTVQPKAVATPVENMIAQHTGAASSSSSSSAALFTAYLGSWRDTADEADGGASFYTFGYIDGDVLARSGVAEPHWAPVDASHGFWQFASETVVVGARTLRRRGATAIADTGTTLALLDEACAAIYAAVPGARYDAAQQGWMFPVGTPVGRLPAVQVSVGSKVFTMQKEDYGFARVGDGSMQYGGIQSRGDLPFSIYGGTFLKAVYAIFDQANRRFGCVQRVERVQNIAPPG